MRASCADDHLGDGFEAVRLVAGIDAFGRIADGEVAPAGKAGFLLQHRQAFFLDRAGIDGRFIDDDVAALEHAADGLGRRQHGAEIGPARAVDRRRHGDDVEIGFGEAGRIVLEAQRRLLEIGRLDLARAVVAGAQLLDALAVDVEADHRDARARKRDGDRQADIAEPDHRDFALVGHAVAGGVRTRAASCGAPVSKSSTAKSGLGTEVCSLPGAECADQFAAFDAREDVAATPPQRAQAGLPLCVGLCQMATRVPGDCLLVASDADILVKRTNKVSTLGCSDSHSQLSLPSGP